MLSGGGPHPTLFGPLLVAPDDSWKCNRRGLPGPFSINVQLYEDDDYWPEFNPYLFGDEDDDLIGGARRFYSVEQLAAAMPRVGDHLSDRVTLGGPCGLQGPDDECVKHPLSSSGP